MMKQPTDRWATLAFRSGVVLSIVVAFAPALLAVLNLIVVSGERR